MADEGLRAGVTGRNAGAGAGAGAQVGPNAYAGLATDDELGLVR